MNYEWDQPCRINAASIIVNFASFQNHSSDVLNE